MTVQLPLLLPGGTAPYAAFAWSNGATTAIVTGLAAGTYTVTATDANLCTDTETITIAQPAALVAAITLGNNVSCNGGNDGSATASATGGTTAYSFAWSNGAATATATGLAVGSYTVTITDANLCTDTETIIITEPAALVASIALGSNVSCNGGNDGSATASTPLVELRPTLSLDWDESSSESLDWQLEHTP